MCPPTATIGPLRTSSPLQCTRSKWQLRTDKARVTQQRWSPQRVKQVRKACETDRSISYGATTYLKCHRCQNHQFHNCGYFQYFVVATFRILCTTVMVYHSPFFVVCPFILKDFILWTLYSVDCSFFLLVVLAAILVCAKWGDSLIRLSPTPWVALLY